MIAGANPRLEGRVENTIGRVPVQQWNTVAEIRGSERPGEVVILGAHLDSWDLGHRQTDNGTGSMVVLEAARALAQSGLKPKRTIRFILFSGEEEGLLGSRPMRRRMPPTPTASRRSWCSTTAPAPLRARRSRAAREFAGLWHRAARPGGRLGADSVRDASKSGTDHLSFLPYGVPGFNFDQLPRGTTTPTTRRPTPTTKPFRPT